MKTLPKASGLMLKISCVPVSVSLGIASLTIGSGTLVTAPYLMAGRTNSANLRQAKSRQCRALFSTVVSSKNMGPGFYRRKAGHIRALRLSDRQLRSFQTRFSTTFSRLDSAQQNRNRRASIQLGKQAASLVTQLNRYCFK